ncbi:hypothetical protein NC652_005717 [Populus alba x Populus x berolinensis]|nr:hypothetical protein NC652_005717 [Populus alba x Populus x berolinensis]
MPRPALPPDLSKQSVHLLFIVTDSLATVNRHVATPCGAALSSWPNVTGDLANLLWLVMGSYQPFNLNRIRSGQKAVKKTRRSVRSANHAPLRITCACKDAPQPSLFPRMYHPRANTALFPPAALDWMAILSELKAYDLSLLYA